MAALEHAVASRRFDKPELRAAVADLARCSRANGVLPQTLVTELKVVVRGDGLPVANWWREVLTDRLVRWGVEAYYGIQPDQPADR